MSLEKGIISCVIKDESCLSKLLSVGVTEADFVEIEHKVIFDYALRFSKRGLKFSLELFCTDENLTSIVPADYIFNTEMLTSSSTLFPKLFEDFVDKLNKLDYIEKGRLLNLALASKDFGKAKEVAFEMQKDRIILTDDNEKLYAIVQRTKPWILKDGLIETGIFDLDQKCGTIRRQELVIIAGRPGQGKTSFASQVALTNAQRGKRVQFFSLEMSKELIVEKMEAQLLRNEVREQDHDCVVKKSEGLDISISEETDLDKIVGLCKLEHSKKQLDLIVIDYVQIIKCQRFTTDMKDCDKLPIVMEALNRLARQLDIPIIALAQLNRNSDNEFRAPILADLAGSSAIEKWGHRVILIYRPSKDENGEKIDMESDPHPTIIEVQKSRNSGIGKVWTGYFGSIATFKNLGQAH